MRRRRARLLVAAVACAACLAAGGKARAEPAPGGVELVTRDGHVVRSTAFGLADLEQSTPLRLDSVFRIASLTKQFTAVATLRLVEDGALSLDDTLALRLPDCPAPWRPITIRQLLGHTSGLSGDMSPVLRRLREDLSPAQLVALHAAIALASPPGTRFEYANLNYWILGLVIESASATPYAEFVHDRVLVPAGLSSTRIGSWTTLIRHRARGYRKAPDGEYQNAAYFSSELGYAAGGFVSTAGDLAKWYDALGRGAIVSRDLLELAWIPTLLPNGENTGYGLGWYVTTVAGHRAIHHGGSTFGFRSYVFWVPALKIFAAVLENSEGEEPRARAETLLKGAIAAATH